MPITPPMHSPPKSHGLSSLSESCMETSVNPASAGLSDWATRLREKFGRTAAAKRRGPTNSCRRTTKRGSIRNRTTLTSAPITALVDSCIVARASQTTITAIRGAAPLSLARFAPKVGTRLGAGKGARTAMGAAHGHSDAIVSTAANHGAGGTDTRRWYVGGVG